MKTRNIGWLIALMWLTGGGCGDEAVPPAEEQDLAGPTLDVTDTPDSASGVDAPTLDPGAPAPDPGAADVADEPETEADTVDAIDVPAGDDGPVEPTARCDEALGTLTCDHHTTTLWSGLGGYEPREVHWQLPLGDAPPAGWPVAILFQGSVFSAELAWIGNEFGAYGAYYQTRTIQRLLESGYAVVTPEAHLDGTTYWDTNIAPWNYAWETSPDHQLMLDIFAAIEDGTFGPLDSARLYATGISSGGYMTSRMAVSYPGQFRALAIHSGSYATCAAALCAVPSLPDDHPPTLFVHGAMDTVVPLWTMELYRSALETQNTPVEAVIDSLGVHMWLPQAPDEIPAFFDLWP